MFRIVQGAPGSGKTYYAVNYLKKFAKYEKLYNVMLLDPDVLLVTNIEDVRVQHLTIEEFRQEDLINPDKLRAYLRANNYKRVIYIHDEAQRTFGGIRENKEFFFFEYSRHLGIDIFLLVQTVSALPRRLTEVCEYVIDARPRTLGVMGFQYDLKDPRNGNKIGVVTLKKDQNVFRLYRSFEVEEIDKPKKLVFRKLLIGVVVMVLAIGVTTTLLKHAFGVKSDSSLKSAIEAPKSSKKELFSKGVTQSKAGPKSKSLEDLRGNKGVAKEPIKENSYYVFHSGKEDTEKRPNGKLRGVSNTDKGVYYFYGE